MKKNVVQIGTNDSLSDRVRIKTSGRSRVLSILDHPRISEPLKPQTEKRWYKSVHTEYKRMQSEKNKFSRIGFQVHTVLFPPSDIPERDLFPLVFIYVLHSFKIKSFKSLVTYFVTCQ